MRINDGNLNQLSLFITVGIHALLFIVIILFSPSKKIIQEESPQIPVSVYVDEIIIKKPIKKKPVITPKKRKSKPIPSHSPASVSKSKSKPKPKKLPGDRALPILSSKKAPIYPKDAISLGLEGTVVVDVTVNTKGRISSIKLVTSSGHDSLDTSFINTVKSSYAFKPKRVMGVNKTGLIRLSYRFNL